MLVIPQNFIPQSSAQFFASKLFFIENFRFWFSCSAEELVLPPKPGCYDQSEVWADWRLIGSGAVAEYKSDLKIMIHWQLNDFFIYIFGDILTRWQKNDKTTKWWWYDKEILGIAEIPVGLKTNPRNANDHWARSAIFDISIFITLISFVKTKFHSCIQHSPRLKVMKSESVIDPSVQLRKSPAQLRHTSKGHGYNAMWITIASVRS